MKTRPLAISVVAAAAFASTIAAPLAQASIGLVINGVPNPPLASAAVLMESDTSACTGVLLTPNLLATAAHCFVDASGTVTEGPEAWRFYAPGANTDASEPTGIRATQLFVAPGYRDDGTSDGRDLAFVVLDAPLGAPTVTRVATVAEVAALAATGATLQQVGYGQTVPRAVPDAPTAPIPYGTSAPIDEWIAQDGLITLRTDGTAGTCAGDSGSPWIASSQGELLLVGVLSSGDGAPCDPQEGGNHDYVVAISAHPDLLRTAVAAAGAQPLTSPSTCIAVKGSKNKCVEGRTWTYSFCWAAPKYRLEMQENGAWASQVEGAGRKARSCGGRFPYLIEVTGTVPPGTTRYRLVVPRQAKVSRTLYDPFTVTST